jgi:decaprenyl-phosphate phosphoribosyltransferase
VTITAVRPQASALGSLPAALRVRQWTKNLLVLAPLLPAAASVGGDEVRGAGIAFAMFCLLSSAVYLVNDVVDAEGDRLHPVKRHRPIAAGTLAPSAALVLSACLATGAMVLAATRGSQLVLVAVAYLVVQVAYCLALKREPVLELAAVASGFLLRALAGGVGAGVPLSSWFLLAAGFGSLFVAAGKRYGEAVRGQRDGAAVRAVVRAYSVTYLRFVWTTTASLVVATYALWAFQVQAKSGSPWAMVSTVPFVLALLRYAVNVDAGRAEEPEEVVLGDRMLLGLGLVWAATLVVATLA